MQAVLGQSVHPLTGSLGLYLRVSTSEGLAISEYGQFQWLNNFKDPLRAGHPGRWSGEKNCFFWAPEVWDKV